MRHRSTVGAGAALGLALLTACGGGNGTSPSTTAGGTSSSSTTMSTTSPVGSSTTAPSTPVGPSSSSSPVRTLSSIPVYYLGESQKSFKLFREFRVVPDTGGAIASAVSAMTRLAPLDPDYLTPWRPASRVHVARVGGNLAVDLSADAFASTTVGSEVAAAAIQQLVYTATAAAAQSGSPATTVSVTKDGKAADAWGVVRIGAAMRRAPIIDVQALAWVVTPQQGEVRPAGTVSFTGYGTSFEATFGWVIRTAAGRTVAQGSAMGGTGTGGFCWPPTWLEWTPCCTPTPRARRGVRAGRPRPPPAVRSERRSRRLRHRSPPPRPPYRPPRPRTPRRGG